MANQGIELNRVKKILLEELKKENAYWSYGKDAITIDTITDENLIADTLRYLDLSEIKILFGIFPYKKIKNVWRRKLIPEGDYLYTLNRFFAWYLFDVKHPDTYLKSEMTRYTNKLIG